MPNSIIRDVLCCPSCGAGHMTWSTGVAQCGCGRTLTVAEGLVYYTPRVALDEIPEVGVRDRQSQGYLEHPKFPTQRFRFEQFLNSAALPAQSLPVLELGAGPGPYTPLLLSRGHHVMAVDFSSQSLAINRQRCLSSCDAALERALFVVADLRQLQLAPHSTSLLTMCDFLQHLGDRTQRDAFLNKALGWLAPGGRFYLSFFNTNIINVIKGDIRGSFADGGIPYERLRVEEVIDALPPGIRVDKVVPMNILHGAGVDRLATSLPLARHVARMMAISGRKVS